jgi:hypothetical protein
LDLRSSFSLLAALLAAGREAPPAAGALVVVGAEAGPRVVVEGPLFVSFSRALVLERTGLASSPSLFMGDPAADLLASFPDNESPDWNLPEGGRVSPLPVPTDDSLEPGGRAAAAPGLPVAEDVEGCRVTLDAGKAGGPMEVRAPPTDGRALGPAPPVEVRALDGVPVLEVAALEVAVERTCFVGDLVGDLAMLGGLEARGAGLGLGAFRLIRLPIDGSATELGRPKGTAPALEARRAGAALGAGAARMMVTVVGLTNMPRPMAQSK